MNTPPSMAILMDLRRRQARPARHSCRGCRSVDRLSTVPRLAAALGSFADDRTWRILPVFMPRFRPGGGRNHVAHAIAR